MKRGTISIIFPLLLATLFLQDLTLASLIHQKYQPSSYSNILTGKYIVEINQQDSTLAFAQSLSETFGDNVKITEQFNHDLFTGVAFTLIDIDPLDDNKLHPLFDKEYVTSIYPIRAIGRPKLTTQAVHEDESIAKAISPHHLTQVDRVHKELENTGKGIIVGIIDSGVDYYHPALGGGFGKGYKVRYGEDLVGDTYDSNQVHPIIRPGPTPLDNCGANSNATGHGTHVSGIVGGKSSNFTGVAPGAKLGMWRVFGCSGTTSNDIIIKALLKAYDTGCDIISLSLGDNNGWSEGPDAVVASRIVKKGTIVVVASGNEGQSGAFTLGTPSTGKGVISVASFDNANNLVNKFKASGFTDAIIYASMKKGKFKSTDLVVGDSHVGGTQDACNTTTIPSSVKGKYALIKRGSCTFSIKASNLFKAGAIGVVVYDNASGDGAFSPSAPDSSIPVLGISQNDGVALLSAVKKRTVTLTFDGKLSPTPLKTAKTVSTFSSVGATYELDLRPNIGAPGGDIYSTLPRYLGSWGLMSGTSMATPYLSGAIALYLKSAKKTGKSIKPMYVLEEFQHYAYKAPLKNGAEGLDSPIRQGAGLIQVYDTLQQHTHITPGQVSFNDTSSNQRKSKTFTIKNYGSKTVSYHISNNVSLSIAPYDLASTGYTYIQPVNYTHSAAKLRISKKSIKLAPGKSIHIKVSVIPPHTDPKQHIMYGGYIQFKSSNKENGLDLSIPYFGVVGRQVDLPIFDRDFPYLSDDSTGRVAYEANETLILHRHNKTSSAYVVTRYITPTALLQTDLIDVKTSKVFGKALPDQTYVPRNTLNPGEQAQIIKWNGTYLPDSDDHSSLKGIPVPEGTYALRMKALHVFGNPDNEDDFDSWTSSHIKITN
ncbi:peptidase S8/S53 domain-containing protein [Chlamydoabsidia padenii]|nr:peptidase S8/S53 domain-containing protein [Chlamydoabsidia padenii]